MNKEQARKVIRIVSHRAVIVKGLRIDGRCMHGMLPGQCSYCADIKMPKYAHSVGAAWIK